MTTENHDEIREAHFGYANRIEEIHVNFIHRK
jgi:hypothetical protein